MTHVIHEIPPVYDDRSKILILGSFPSVKSREGQFFYHHKQNRFWKVLAAVFEDTLPETIEEKKEFLLRIKKEAQNMTTLINDILMISRLEAGTTVQSKNEFDISLMLDEIFVVS